MTYEKRLARFRAAAWQKPAPITRDALLEFLFAQYVPGGPPLTARDMPHCRRTSRRPWSRSRPRGRHVILPVFAWPKLTQASPLMPLRTPSVRLIKPDVPQPNSPASKPSLRLLPSPAISLPQRNAKRPRSFCLKRNCRRPHLGSRSPTSQTRALECASTGSLWLMG